MNSLEGVMVVGLTGQTGAGKTTVCRIFIENGFAVINADMVSRFVVEKDKPCLLELAEMFGDDIIDSEGELDRKKLAEIVFSDKSKLEILNSICYPYITSEILNRIRSLSENNQKLILLDAPTLFESRADDFCEIVISVVSRIENRLARIMERDGITEEEALNRINSQYDEKFFVEHSEFIIKNNKDMKNLYNVAKEVSDKVKDYYNKKFVL